MLTVETWPVDRLIAEETIDGESFRQTVSDWEVGHPELALPSEPIGPLVALRQTVSVGES